MQPTVSIILRTWNSLPYVKLTVESLRESVVNIDHEIIVVDDNSEQETIDYLMGCRPDTLILNHRKHGAPGVTSQGTSVAQGKYVAVLDSDVLLTNQWLSKLIDELDKNQGDLISANRFKRMIHPDTGKSLRHAWYDIKRCYAHLPPLEQFHLYSNGRNINDFAKAVLQHSDPKLDSLVCPPDCVGSSCIVYLKDSIKRVGGFCDYDYWPYAGDDVDLCWRIGLAGGKVLRSENVLIHHFEHASVVSNGLNYQNSAQLNNKRLFARWSNELDKFIVFSLSQGISLESLCEKYWFLRLYLDYKGSEA